MTTKYGKYIMREPNAKWSSVEPESEREKRKSIRINSNLINSIGVDVAFMGVTPEVIKEMEGKFGNGKGHPSHKHDVDEYLFFMGSDPTSILDFGAEVELTLGEGKDKEIHVIDTACIVYIPKGLAHLPMIYRKLDKPIFFGHMLMAPDYEETRLE